MAHNVRFSMPERELGKASMEFKVRKNSSVFGTLKISKGGVAWILKDKKYGHKMTSTTWSDVIISSKLNDQL
jgi:hypothetical protein